MQSSSENNPLQELHSILNNDTMARIAQSITQRLAHFYEDISRHLLKYLMQNSIDSTYQPFIKARLEKLVFSKHISEGPLCSKIISNKYYHCFDCSFPSETVETSLCYTCFIRGNHQKHNFRVLKTNFAVCDCGNPQTMKPISFCRDHSQEKQTALSNSIEARLNRLKEQKNEIVHEMQFILYILIRINKISLTFIDSQKKKDIFGTCIVIFMNSFIDQSYVNQCRMSSLLTSSYSSEYPPICKDQTYKIQNVTILHIIFRQLSKLDNFGTNFSNLLLRLYSVQKIREQVIIEYFDATSSLPTFQVQKLSVFSFQYVSSLNSKLIEKLLRRKELKPFIISGHFSNFAQKTKCFLKLYDKYKLLLNSKNSDAIISLLLEDINICDLSNYCSIQQQKKHNELINIMECMYFDVLLKIMKTLKTSDKYLQVLKKIIRQTYDFLKKYKKSQSFSIERTFAFAMFTYFKGNIDQLLLIDLNNLLQLVGEQLESPFYQLIDQILGRIFGLTKLQKYNQYKKIFSNYPERKILISIDHIFAKILLNILMREEIRHCDQGFQSLQKYLLVKQNTMDTLFDLYLTDENSKSQMEDMISMNFLETCLTISNFLFLSQTCLNELIIKNYLGYADQTEIIQFLKFLTYVYQPNNRKQFKNNAELFLRNPIVVEDFIKKHHQETKRQYEKVPPKNIFNISYCSDYLKIKQQKQKSKLYMVKARSKKQSELSRYIFSSQIIEHITKIFRTYLERYVDYFKESESNTSNIILINTFQCIVNLHIQTKSREIKNLIDETLQKKLYNSMQNSDGKQTIQMYINGQQILTRQQKQGKNSLENRLKDLKKQQARKKIDEKKKLMKQKQSLFLDQIPKEDLEQNNPLSVNCKDCIVCKKSSEQNRLHYLCKLRYSQCLTKAMLGINDHMLLITTCGHMVHENCLRSVPNINFQRLQMDCFLCKSDTNMLFPYLHDNQLYSETLVNHILNNNAWKREITKYNLQREDHFSPKYSLYKSFCYQFLLYAFNYPRYFAVKMLPILRQIIKIFKIFYHQIGYNSLNHDWPAANHLQKQVTILYFIQGSIQILLQNSIDAEEDKFTQIHKLKQKYQSNYQHQDFDYIYLLFQKLIREQKHNSNIIEEIMKGKTKVKNLHSKIFQLPNDLVDLNKQMGQCSNCHHITSKILICFLCSQKICHDCRPKLESHLSLHNGKTFYIKVQRGFCLYYQYGRFFQGNPLYLDYVDDPIRDEETEPKKNQYLLSQAAKNRLTQDVLNEDFQKNLNVFELIDLLLRRQQ